jgi:hypothetical protein
LNAHRSLAGLLLLACAPFLSASAEASFIAMGTQTTAEVHDDRVLLRVAATNQGDEPAWNVRIEALFPKGAQTSKLFRRLEVGATAEHTFEWNTPGDRYRKVAIPIVTHYTDSNYYAFSGVSGIVLALGEPPASALEARTETVDLDPAGRFPIRLSSADGEPHAVRVRLVAPAEISVRPASAEVEVPVTGDGVASFELENHTGLPESVYGVWAVVTEDTPEGIVESGVAGTVRLLEPSYPSFRFAIATLFGIAALLFLAWQLGAFRRFRRP